MGSVSPPKQGSIKKYTRSHINQERANSYFPAAKYEFNSVGDSKQPNIPQNS